MVPQLGAECFIGSHVVGGVLYYLMCIYMVVLCVVLMLRYCAIDL